MKRNRFNKLSLWGAAVALLGLTACSPEDFTGVDEGGLALASDVQVTATVDSLNNVTFTMPGTGIYPEWILPVDGKVVQKNQVYSTQNPLTKLYAYAGDYEVYYRVGNHNGMSQGMGKTTFHIDNTIVDMSEYVGSVANKSWRIDNTVPAHLACGPSGSDGTQWWAAQPNEKAAVGLYDDRLSFTEDGTYTYDPGTGGTVYVNTGCTIFADYHQDADFMAPVDKQSTSYSFEFEGDVLYMKFPSKTLFPYIPTDAAYNDELKLRVESISPSKLVLVYDNGDIAWHYVLTSADEGFRGFNANSDCNLWKNCTFTHTYFYAPGWSQIEDPTIQEEPGVNNYVFTLPEATTDQWQAQVFWHTDMTTNAANTYDFSCKITSTKDHGNVTVKLGDEGDDGIFYFVENIKLKANEEYIFYKSDMPGIDISKLKLVLDFGGNQADTKVTVSDVDLQEHGCDGIEAPAEETDKTVYTYDAESNLWKTNVDDKGTDGFSTFFYYAPGWAQIDNPTLTADKGTYTVELPVATFDQWQAQMHLITTIPGEADTPYDFSCKLVPTKDIKGVTLKLTDTASDDNFFFTNRYDLTAGQETVVKIPAVVLPKGAAAALKLVFDFGGCPEGEKITINDIIFQKTAK
ncbi:MAG: hypothetical protein I3J02_04690 [Prevotella sp.]|nr:hypothetical protein [Prevotella sp.]